MLVLTRKPHQAIDCILPDGERITFKLLAVEGSSVRVGVGAPANVRILRSELLDREPHSDE